MPEGTRSTSVNKLDELLSEYAEKRKMSNIEGDIYSEEKSEPENGQLNCQFKDNCQALKYNRGTCPCELYE
jgi:hypothetical protein